MVKDVRHGSERETQEPIFSGGDGETQGPNFSDILSSPPKEKSSVKPVRANDQSIPGGSKQTPVDRIASAGDAVPEKILRRRQAMLDEQKLDIGGDYLENNFGRYWMYAPTGQIGRYESRIPNSHPPAYERAWIMSYGMHDDSSNHPIMFVTSKGQAYRKILDGTEDAVKCNNWVQILERSDGTLYESNPIQFELTVDNTGPHIRR